MQGVEDKLLGSDTQGEGCAGVVVVGILWKGLLDNVVGCLH